MFVIPKYEGQVPEEIEKDGKVRTPSDHLGLYIVISKE